MSSSRPKKIGSRATTTTRTVLRLPPALLPALDKTPEFLARKDQIKKLFREGKILMNSGQYDEAERRFQQILLLDAYNEDASTLLRQVDKARTDVAIGAADGISRASSLAGRGRLGSAHRP